MLFNGSEFVLIAGKLNYTQSNKQKLKRLSKEERRGYVQSLLT